MSATVDSKRLFRIHKNVMEMLKARGYLVLDAELNMDYNQFTNKFGDSIRRDHLTINKAKKHNPSDQIYVFFIDEKNDNGEDKKVGVKLIRKYVDRMEQEKVFNAILIVRLNLSTQVKKTMLDEGFARRYHLEFFQEFELLANIMKHMLVPEHQALSDEEKAALLERYNLKDTQLPRILLNDPVAKYHGLRRGQVVKIIRPSETAGKYVTYRHVV